ncbi:hypothetical protein K503DRAFT_774479 [Rhizopogon vinicolor AM-OR11-026]|uniref:Fatty acid desaturase domain-containing protein n=1 Tax=Rhizopogon vinicolor AM-OR11-026 TaxID=1314800 RepID=A0A1B7MPG5_9AGAM|nr:hypothetical protein K503DRAFT_774479 [Rhizopogon vinicolor AM-OR11-026]
MQPHLSSYWFVWTHLNLLAYCFSIQVDLWTRKNASHHLRPCPTALHFCCRLPHEIVFPSGESNNVRMLSPFPFHGFPTRSPTSQSHLCLVLSYD